MQTTSTPNLTEDRMKSIVAKCLTIVAAMAVLAGSVNAAETQARAAVEHAVEVRTVVGTAEYAYDSTGWRPLQAGKVLHPGAFVRTGSEASVILEMEEAGSLVRVGPMARLEIAKAAPATERGALTKLQARGPAKLTPVVFNMGHPRLSASLQ